MYMYIYHTFFFFRQWTCRQPEPLIELIEHWIPLLPNWILENILDMLVLPKLTLEVEEWNPLTDTVPIHTWIHPWLPLLRTYTYKNLPLVIRKHKETISITLYYYYRKSFRYFNISNNTT